MQRVIFGSKPFDGTYPEKFAFDFPFDKPFLYAPAKGSLCYEVLDKASP